MISRLRIENYQSHALTDIQLSPTVTVFTGESDQGKTAVLRALRKVVRNTPVGDFFIRWDQKACRVLVEVNGVAVERVVGVRNSGLNTYTVGADAYNNFGTSVPEEVRIALGVADVQVFDKDKIDFNIHTQHEGEFLVGQSGVEALRGRIFARITGSDVVNRAIVRVNSALRTVKQEIERQRVQRTALQADIDALAYVENLGALLSRVEQSSARCTQLVDVINELSSSSTALYELDCQIRDTQAEIDRRPEMDVRPVEELAARTTALRTVLSELRTTWARIVRLKKFADHASVLDTQSLQEAQTRVQAVRVLQTELKTAEAQMQNTQTLMSLNDEQAAAAEAAYTKLRQELGVCPICEKPFEDEHQHEDANEKQ